MKSLFAAAALAAAIVPATAGQLNVVDARGKPLGAFYAPDILVLPIDNRLYLMRWEPDQNDTSTLNVVPDPYPITVYLTADCTGQAYIPVNTALPYAAVDSDTIWYPSYPLQQTTPGSYEYPPGYCYTGGVAPELIGKAKTTTFQKLGFRAPFVVRQGAGND